VNDYIKMGECRKPHGLKGAMLFHLYNTEESALKEGSSLKLIPLDKISKLPLEGKLFTIASIQFANRTIVTLDGITDRTELENILPFAIYFKRSDFKELNEGEFYFSDLIGLKVVNENGHEVGLVKSFYDNGAQAVLVIETKEDSIELPFVDQFFPTINLAEKYIVMNASEFV
jgi:16S rRNA processing protein RimM